MNVELLDYRKYTSCFCYLADTVNSLLQSHTQTTSPLPSLTKMVGSQILVFQISPESRKGLRTLFGP